MAHRRILITVFVAALAWGGFLAAAIDQPGYTDAYYYFNAAQRLVEGQGLTDPYLWTYINAPDHLPGPSHTYWMPGASLIAALSMRVVGEGFGVAQIPSVLCFAGLVTLACWIGASWAGSRRHAWSAALLVLFAGFYTPFWTTTDTFALYGLVGALALIAIGEGRKTGRWQWYAGGGACAGLAHLTRADGLLFVIVLLLVAGWPDAESGWKQRMRMAATGLAAYLLIMAPWFVRNMMEIGTPLPTGGLQTAWLRSYDELVNYPPGASIQGFFDWGLSNILQSRWEAFRNNLGTFVAVETWVILGPFVLGGLWLRRRMPVLLGVILYAIGLHLAMTFVFAYPGYRGGLFHSASALLPFWAVLGLIGLDAGVAWAAHRRHWHTRQAQIVFNAALVVLAIILSVSITVRRFSGWNDRGATYQAIAADLPGDAVLMINDPAALYYLTGRSGVVVPNAEPDVVPEIAARYGVTHLVLDVNRTESFTALFLGFETRPFLRLVKVYDRETADSSDDVRLYEIVRPESE